MGKSNAPKNARKWWREEQTLALLEGRTPNWALAYAKKAIRYDEIPKEIRRGIRQRGTSISNMVHNAGFGAWQYSANESYDDRGGTHKRGKFKFPHNKKEHRK